MTNSSPPNPQPSEPSQPPTPSPEERRIRQNIRMRAYRDNSEEWIAGLVAFGAIGAILFWSLGGRKSDFNLSQSGFLSSSSQTTETTDATLDSQDFASTDNLDVLNTQQESSDPASSKEIRPSDSISIGSAAKDNSNQKNNYFRSVTPIAAIPSITKADKPKTTTEEGITELESESEVVSPEPEAVTPQAESETESGIVAIEPESESEVVTESETEPEISATDTESESEVVTESETEPEIAAIDTESESEVETPELEEEANTETTSVSAFSDVAPDYWAYPFLAKLGEEKLLPESETFEPDAPITRAGMAGLISHGASIKCDCNYFA